MTDRIAFDTHNPDFALVRQVVLRRLRAESSWRSADEEFSAYVEFVPARPNDRQEFALLALDVIWQLVVEEIIAPGYGWSQPNLPRFRLTQYGQRVLANDEYEPHDRTGYLARLQQRIGNTDATVLAYLEESLETFVRGNLVASMVMLGVAAERVFDLLCEALEAALLAPREKVAFSRLLERHQMKPKVYWAHDKLRRLQEQHPRLIGFPENAALMITAIYDMIRSQRNDLGHPRDVPPRLGRGDAHANLQIFPRYYETAEVVRRFLATNQV